MQVKIKEADYNKFRAKPIKAQAQEGGNQMRAKNKNPYMKATNDAVGKLGGPSNPSRN